MSFESRYSVYLTESLFTCIVPDLYTRSKEELNRFGYRVSGDRNFDKRAHEMKATIMVPIYKILEFYSVGLEIEFPKEEEMALMHEYISGYLKEWGHHLENSLNIEVDKYSELLKHLQDFNEQLYIRINPSLLMKGEAVEPPSFGLRKFSVKNMLSDSPKEIHPDYRDTYGNIADSINKRRNWKSGE